MTREGDDHSDPDRIASQGPPTTTGGDHLWWGLEGQSEANTEMKSRVSCFSSLLNFNSNESDAHQLI